MCYERRLYYPMYVVEIVPYRWNSRCLEAPKLPMYDGYYTWPQIVRRSVVHGLVVMPKPMPVFTIVEMEAINNRFKEILQNAQKSADSFLRSLRTMSHEDSDLLEPVAKSGKQSLEEDILQAHDVMGTENRTVYAFGVGGSVSVTYPVLRRQYEPSFPLAT